MAKQKSGSSLGGFVFNVFNIGFTVFMFILPTIGLVYWYLYIRDPGGGVAPKREVIVRQMPAPQEPAMDVEPKRVEPAEPDRPLTSGFFNESFEPRTDISDDVSTTQPKSTPPSRKEYESRSWSDESGKFSVQAKFYSVTGDRVKIVTDDERQIEVPIVKLSESDKEYVRSIFREKGIQPKF